MRDIKCKFPNFISFININFAINREGVTCGLFDIVRAFETRKRKMCRIKIIPSAIFAWASEIRCCPG